MSRTAVQLLTLVLFIQMIDATRTDARVGAPDHEGAPGAHQRVSAVVCEEAKHRDSRYAGRPRNASSFDPGTIPRKRTLLRAIGRAERNDDP